MKTDEIRARWAAAMKFPDVPQEVRDALADIPSLLQKPSDAVKIQSRKAATFHGDRSQFWVFDLEGGGRVSIPPDQVRRMWNAEQRAKASVEQSGDLAQADPSIMQTAREALEEYQRGETVTLDSLLDSLDSQEDRGSAREQRFLKSSREIEGDCDGDGAAVDGIAEGGVTVEGERVTVEDVMLYGKIYSAAVARMYTEIVTRIAECPACGAYIDQYCTGQYKRTHPGSLHADRRNAADIWRKENRAEYEELKTDLIRYFVQLCIASVLPRKEAAQKFSEDRLAPKSKARLEQATNG